jgi:hypothetical protein
LIRPDSELAAVVDLDDARTGDAALDLVLVAVASIGPRVISAIASARSIPLTIESMSAATNENTR